MPVAGSTHFATSHQIIDLLGIDGFVLHQRIFHAVQHVHVIQQDLLGTVVVAVDHLLDLSIDNAGSVIGHVLGLGHAATEEHLAIFFRVEHGTETLGHAPLGHHLAGDVGGTLDVVGCTGRYLLGTVDQLFRQTATVQAGDHGLQMLLGVAPAILLRQVHGHTQRTAARNDGDLVDRVMIRYHATNDGVTRFMISRHLLLGLFHHHGATFCAHHDLVLRLLELGHGHHTAALARREQSGFVDQVGQIGAGETRSTAGNQRRVDVIRQRHLAHMHLEDLLAATHIRQTDHDLTVETTRTQQCRIQYVRTVGSGDDDDAFIALKAVHLDQHLVQGLLAFIVTTAQTGATLATDGVNLIDEDDAGGGFLGLLEHVAYPGGTHTHEHLDEIGTRNGEERYLGLTRNGLGQQGLTGTGRTYQQYAGRDLAAQFLEFARVAQIVDQLLDLFLGLIATGYVGEGGLDLILTHQASLAFAKRHGTFATAALHLTHEEDPDTDQQQHREPGDKDGGDQRRLFRLLAHHFDIVIEHVVEQLGIRRRDDGGEAFTGALDAINDLAIHPYFTDLLLGHFFNEAGIVQLATGGIAGAEAIEHRHQHDGDDQPQD